MADTEDASNIIEDQTEEQQDDKQSRKKSQFRWKLNHDLLLAKEVENLLPFDYPSRQQGPVWARVADELNKLFSISTLNKVSVNRRFEIIIEAHRRTETKNRYKSGVEEEIGELENRLTNLLNLLDDKRQRDEQVSESKQKKVDEEKVRAEEIRGAACKTMEKKEELGDETSNNSKKRASESSLIDMWKEKQEQDRMDRETQHEITKQFKQQKLDIQMQQMQLERERFEHQKELDAEDLKIRQRQLSITEQERNAQIATQNALLQMLLQRNTESK